MDRPSISPEEAREALDLIDRTTQHMRRSLAHGGAPYFLLIWGVVWMLGFGATHFLGPDSPTVGLIWMVLDTIGIIASFAVGWWISKQMRSPRYGATVGIYWLAWIVYGALIVYFAHPQSGNQLSMLVALLAMFGYVTTGILYRSRFLTGLGLVMTGLILAGYLLWPAYFNLWMAVLGGGSLIAAGVYILRFWR
ncbi:MAG: hypothetical protein GXO55_09290 [Chloroflexi bacterium]|nr:hypothetical protein [Chloroflexota bacterium]